MQTEERRDTKKHKGGGREIKEREWGKEEKEGKEIALGLKRN